MSKNLLIISFFIFLLAHNIYANACKKNCTKKSRVKRNSNGDPLIFVTTVSKIYIKKISVIRSNNI